MKFSQRSTRRTPPARDFPATILPVFNEFSAMAEQKSQRTSITRRFHASILGSLHQLGTGGSEGACWSTQNGESAPARPRAWRLCVCRLRPPASAR